MIPAEVKKKENIAEYIIHMYQTEDLIFSYDFNLNEILEYVIKHMSKDENEIKSLLLWYADIITQMQEEKVVSTNKRLRSTQFFVSQLSKLHNELYTKDKEYQDIYNGAEDKILMQIKYSDGLIDDPIQICINGLYGMLLVQLNGKSLNAQQKTMVEDFGKILAYLNKVYVARL